MNPQDTHSLSDELHLSSRIGMEYREGLSYYNQWLHYQQELYQLIQEGGDESKEVICREQLVDYRKLAIEHCKNSLLHTGSCEEQIIKIRSLLLLVKLYNQGVWTGERYFYNAVEIAELYLRDTFWSTPLGDDIIAIYLSDIDPEFSTTFPKEYIPRLAGLIRMKILSESHTRIASRLEKVADTKNYLNDAHSTHATISKIEDAFGPIRLLVISEESGEILISHGIDTIDIGDITEKTGTIRYTTMSIFDKSRKYKVVIDRGSNEARNQFKESHLQHIIEPIIERCIKIKECSLSRDASDNDATIESVEPSTILLPKRNNYRFFISSIIAKYKDTSVPHETDTEYIDNFIRAIDISRVIRAHAHRSKSDSSKEISEEIDHILGRKVRRGVLGMVQAMLLSHTERMNGSGYPFGLSKKNIPLKGRIYAIIRAYEALHYTYRGNASVIRHTMTEWGQGGYFDTDILGLFFEHIEKGQIHKMQSHRTDPGEASLSAYRKKRYDGYIEKWYSLIGIARDVEEIYNKVREAEGDPGVENIMFSRINKLQQELLQRSKVRKIIGITLHGKTETDVPGGPPGSEDESIIQEGEISSRSKGEFLGRLEFRLFSSPLKRAVQSAIIIVCEKTRKCLEACSSCTKIHLEKTLNNQIKSRENGRDGSFLERLIADNPTGLTRFIKELISSAESSTNLFVTHRDTARHAILIINNLLAQDQVYGEKTPIDNDVVLTYLIEGGRLVEWNLFFDISNWESVIQELNIITESIFGQVFYKGNPKRRVNLIALHDSFLDFLDLNLEKSPEKIGILFEKLEENTTTKHCGDILRKSVLFLS